MKSAILQANTVYWLSAFTLCLSLSNAPAEDRSNAGAQDKHLYSIRTAIFEGDTLYVFGAPRENSGITRSELISLLPSNHKGFTSLTLVDCDLGNTKAIIKGLAFAKGVSIDTISLQGE